MIGLISTECSLINVLPMLEQVKRKLDNKIKTGFEEYCQRGKVLFLKKYYRRNPRIHKEKLWKRLHNPENRVLFVIRKICEEKM